MASVTLFPSANTMTSSISPNSNYAATNFIELGSDGRTGSGTYYGWVRFDLSSIPAGSTINSAILNTYEYFAVNNPEYANYALGAYNSINITWPETITFNTEPSFNGTPTDTNYFGNNVGTVIPFTITSDVITALSTGGVSWSLRPENPGAFSDFNSFRFSRVPYSATHPPHYSSLVIDYTPPAASFLLMF